MAFEYIAEGYVYLKGNIRVCVFLSVPNVHANACSLPGLIGIDGTEFKIHPALC